MEIAYAGECMCIVKGCEYKAYYVGQLCGRHCAKEKRKYLPKNKKTKENMIKDKLAKALPSNTPMVTATKMRMMQTPIPRDGFLLVCPNNKHGHNFGFPGNYSTLSPMRLGPVVDGGEFMACSIENYHQFAKVFPNEVTDELCDCGRSFTHNKPSSLFFENRKKGYNDKVPHRYKYDKKNIPVYSVQNDCHYTYVESRYFYCNQMEILATREEAFKELLKKYTEEGYSLDIHGYDAYTPNGTDAETLFKHYCDESRPFGHEMVILTLLVLHKEPDKYPWKRYKREHEDIYESIKNKRVKLSE